MYSKAVTKFYKFINSITTSKWVDHDEWTYEKVRFYRKLDQKIKELSKKSPKKCTASVTKTRFQKTKPKPVQESLIRRALAITIVHSSQSKRYDRAQSFPSSRTKRDRTWLQKVEESQIAIRTSLLDQRPTLRLPHFKSSVPVLTQMLVVNILKSPNLDPRDVNREIDTQGCSNCIRHLAKTLLTNFTTSVKQKWNGLATRVFRISSRKPEGCKNAIRSHFSELQPFESQIKLDPLFWYNQWCFTALFFDSIFKFSRKFKYKL